MNVKRGDSARGDFSHSTIKKTIYLLQRPDYAFSLSLFIIIKGLEDMRLLQGSLSKSSIWKLNALSWLCRFEASQRCCKHCNPLHKQRSSSRNTSFTQKKPARVPEWPSELDAQYSRHILCRYPCLVSVSVPRWGNANACPRCQSPHWK